MITAWHLAFKEIWRNRGRFLLFALVIALIALLVLFIAALGEGLGSGNREYLEKVDADLIVYQAVARLSIGASRVDLDTRRAIRALEGVNAVAPVGFGSAAVPEPGGSEFLDVALIGVEPGMPGEPPVVAGEGFIRDNVNEAIIDRTVALVTGLGAGDDLVVRTVKGNEDEFYTVRIVGVSSSQKYGLRPSVFLPKRTWDKIRPDPMVMGANGLVQPMYNVLFVSLADPSQAEVVTDRIKSRLDRVEVVDPRTAYENTPGYREQQSTLATQNAFALLIGVLVIGGFFQIQTLQKVPQIGMLKAIGTPNGIIGAAALLQIVITNLVGIALGALVAYVVSLVFPPNIPIVFEPQSSAIALASILLMGPLGGLVSVRYSLRIEPLTALGLGK
ncbi:MAG: ABC transporter permease [Chloroflexi bacterium]|nr:ABC transporter permease [Chloroflexota bacterium]